MSITVTGTAPGSSTILSLRTALSKNSVFQGAVLPATEAEALNHIHVVRQEALEDGWVIENNYDLPMAVIFIPEESYPNNGIHAKRSHPSLEIMFVLVIETPFEYQDNDEDATLHALNFFSGVAQCLAIDTDPRKGNDTYKLDEISSQGPPSRSPIGDLSDVWFRTYMIRS